MEVKIIGNMDNTIDHTFESANRVYDKDLLCPTIPTCSGGGIQPKVIEETKCCVAMRGRNPDNPSDRQKGSPMEQRLEMNKDGLVNTLTTVQKDNLVMEGVKNEDEREENLLQILRGRIEKEAFCKWAIRGLFCILQTQILQQNVYAERLFENWKQSADMGQFTSDGTIDKCFVITEENLRNLWKDWQVRCTPYRRQFSEQQSEQFTNYMQELPYEDSQNKRYLQDLREASEGIGILQQALYQIQEIWESSICKVQYRIRKLTPRETWRLMGYTDKDFEKAAFEIKELYIQGDNDKCNARLKAVQEKPKHTDMESFVSCTINDTKSMETLKIIKKLLAETPENEKTQNVNFVITKSEGLEHLECATNTTKCITFMGMQCILTEEKDQLVMVITEQGKEVKQNTGKYMKITTKLNLNLLKLYIILILTAQIIKSKIYGSTTLRANIQGNIAITDVYENSILLKISDLKMESTSVRVSSSQLYKQAGNAIVKQVLMAIFAQMIPESARQKRL